MTKFFDCGPATFSDQAVEVHAYEAVLFLLPMTIAQYLGCRFLCDAVPEMSSLNPFPLSLAWRHCWPIWLINVGGSAHVGEEQLMAIERIGILTGGGDVPGLNAVIKSATYHRSENDIEIFDLRRGWEALTHRGREQ